MPFKVSFDGTGSTGDIASSTWNFGDGASSTGLVASHTYTTSGTYNVTLRVVDQAGAKSQASTIITAQPIIIPSEPPTAVLSSSTAAGNAPLNVTFNGTSSVAHNATMVSYNWTFGDGSYATGKTTSHTFTTAGTYYTQLTVIDSQGLSDTVSTPIIVIGSAPANVKPVAVIAAITPSGNEPLSFSFDGSQSSDPDGSIAQYNWVFGDGTTGSGKVAQHTYSSADTYTASLQVTDNRGGTATTSAKVVCDTPLSTINIEVGEVSIDTNWVTVAFENTFSHPVVIAGPPAANDTDPALVRIRNITKTGFEIRLQEWDYQDGNHAPETFSYIVIEKGVYTLDNGSRMEAGNFTGSRSFNRVSLQQLYDFTPVVLTQVATENETDAVTGRLRNINQYSFEYKLQEMEKTATAHAPETIGYIAWEPGKGEVSGLLYEIGMTTQSVSSSWFNLNFETKFTDLPFFIAGMQTFAGSDTATVRSQNMSTTTIQVKIEEEQSKDSEINHTKEVVGYFTIGARSSGTDSGTIEADDVPPTVSSHSPQNDAVEIDPGIAVTATFNEKMDAATINGGNFVLRDASNTLISATVAYDTKTNTATLKPLAPLAGSTTYTATIQGGAGGVADFAGNLLTSDHSWSFTTAVQQTQTLHSLWDNSFIPAILSDSDTSAVELGVKFQSSEDGLITALRFYKSAANTGTHVGNLWTAAGRLLASVTFTNETGSGWQEMALPTPVAIAANTTYVASYHTNVGRYSANNAYFAGSGFDNPPLRALADGENGGNGVYRYGAGGFPNQTWNASNYWVDVVFIPAK